MIERAGDILNWLALGLLFPLTMLPFASLLARGRAALGAAFLLALTICVVAMALIFAALAPDLAGEALSQKHFLLFGGLIAATALVNGLGGPEAALRRVEPALAMSVGVIGRGASGLVLTMALLQFVIVILRYVFGVNSIFMQEGVIYLHGAVFLLASGYALLTDDHVRVDIFYREAPARRKAIVDLAGAYLLLFPFCFVSLWAGADYVANAWAVREGSTEASGIQAVFLLKTLIPIFAVLLALAGVVMASRATRVLQGADQSPGAAPAGSL